MIRQATFDPSRRLDLFFRISRNGEKTFTFLDVNGDPFDITGFDFELFIKDNPGSRAKVISLTLGDGLEIPAYQENILNASVTDSETFINEGEYYWELYLRDEKKTWLSGSAFFHNGKFDGISSDTGTITINEGGETIEITIDTTVSVSSTEHWRGAYDASVNAYPSSGGSGTAGAVQAGDEWYVSVSGDLDVSGLGVITVNVGALIISLIDAPGTTPANWRVIQ